MKSPLAVDKETQKKYGITAEMDFSPVAKLSFVETQLEEIKHAMWRSRMDIVHATRLSESDNEVLRNKGLQNLSQHTNEVQQFTGAIEMLSKMIDELKAEYPELQPEA